MAYFNPDAPSGQDASPTEEAKSGQPSIQGDHDPRENAVDRLLREKYGRSVPDERWRGVEAGAYEASITDIGHMLDKRGKEYIGLHYNIEEGEHKDCYADLPANLEWVNRAQFYCTNDWGFERLLKMLQAVTASNPDFDASQAFYDEDWNAFIGKRVGIVLQAHEYYNKYGDIDVALNVMRFMPVDDVPSTPAPPMKHLREEVV